MLAKIAHAETTAYRHRAAHLLRRRRMQPPHTQESTKSSRRHNGRGGVNMAPALCRRRRHCAAAPPWTGRVRAHWRRRLGKKHNLRGATAQQGQHASAATSLCPRVRRAVINKDQNCAPSFAPALMWWEGRGEAQPLEHVRVAARCCPQCASPLAVTLMRGGAREGGAQARGGTDERGLLGGETTLRGGGGGAYYDYQTTNDHQEREGAGPGTGHRRHHYHHHRVFKGGELVPLAHPRSRAAMSRGRLRRRFSSYQRRCRICCCVSDV
ncbi:hypothetical protein JKP88DRAFT_97780 [Tribonema minus]|uniref:Uncharacterized protein n=1 Tax=Tribonema minus TaxID=303371 RepID=A0A836C7N2_9STRA|nr:hypothetical protein JKP88DRAFT_97780 [Tribonema minus]